MKIIHAIFSFDVGGAETMLVDIINRQCKVASVSLIIINKKINIDLLNTLDKSINVCLINRKESSKIQLPYIFIKINQIVGKINPDIIHCHNNKLFPFFIAQRKKTVLTVHDTNLSCLFLKYYQQIFTISQTVKEDIKKRANVDAQLVYNGIKIDEYEQRKDYSPEFFFKIVQISRLDINHKGQHIAIQAMAYLKEKYPDMNYNLFFIGDGEDKDKLKALSIENKIEDRIVFTGQKSRSWIKKHLQEFDVLIQPSLHEGFGLTIIEGFAAGLPVIASNIDGPKEICGLLNAGLLVQVNNHVDLAEKIRLVYQSYISNTLICNNYFPEDKSQLYIFDIETTSKEYINNYNSVINN